MARRKKAEAVDVFDEAIAQQAAADVPAPEAPPPVVEVPQGKRHPTTKSDALAKMTFGYDYDSRPQRALISFTDGKPSEAVREELKRAGFAFSREDQAWEMDVNFTTREQDRMHARQTFEKAAEMRREEFGVGQER